MAHLVQPDGDEDAEQEDEHTNDVRNDAHGSETTAPLRHFPKRGAAPRATLTRRPRGTTAGRKTW
nr:hypothetical protein GCM10025730_13760 [Promicromonospora thailandica]